MRLRWIWFALILGLLSILPVMGQWQAHFTAWATSLRTILLSLTK